MDGHDKESHKASQLFIDRSIDLDLGIGLDLVDLQTLGGVCARSNLLVDFQVLFLHLASDLREKLSL